MGDQGMELKLCKFMDFMGMNADESFAIICA